MADKSKVPVIIMFILLLVSIAAAGLSFMSLEKEKQNSTKLATKVEELEAKKIAASKTIDRLTQESEELKAKLRDSDMRIASLGDELSLEKKSRTEAFAEVDRIRKEAAALASVKSDLEKKLSEKEGQLKNIQDELAAAKNSLQQKIKDAEEKGQNVQLDKIVISSQSQPAPEVSRVEDSENPAQEQQGSSVRVPLEGKVLVVNKEYDFIVINLGQKDGINVQDVLGIYHKNKLLGEAKVEEVRDTMSVATPLSVGLAVRIKEDDKVVRN